jgi:DNA-binding response OmpR family regulator
VKVLILDGDARIRARLADRLTSEGADVVEATALAHAIALTFVAMDAVLLDVHLDAHTGVAGVAKVRAAAPHAVIVVLTNEAGEVHRQECLRHGADAFFDKSTEFDRAVEFVLARPKSATRAP